MFLSCALAPLTSTPGSVSPVVELRILLAAILSILSIAVAAQVPPKIHTQGYLTTSAGTPVDGPVVIVFRLYDAETGGNLLWSEPHALTATNGAYSAVLGEFQALDFGFTGPLYLGLVVGGGAELAPRRPLSPVPYALNARSALAVAPGAVTATSLGIACAGGQVLAYDSASGWGCGSRSCGKGTTACGATCTNPRLDASHCGTCGNACLPGQSCVAGTCN